MTLSRYTDKQLDTELDAISPPEEPAKDAILRLRRAGGTYKSISAAVSLEKNKVRDVCLAANLGGGSVQRQSASTDPAEILALREVGLSYKVIATKLGVPNDIVSRVCHDAGLSPGAPLFRSKSRHPLKAEILGLRRDGYVYKAIADKLDLAVSTVHKVCAGEGLPAGQGTLGRKDEKKRHIQKARVEEIRQLREEGKTLVTIGDMFGISRERVRQVCEGIPVPDIRKRCNCHECGKEFVVRGKPGHSSIKYCSHRCGKISHKRSKQKPDTKWSNHGYVELICVGCSKTFTRTNRMYALAEYYREQKGLHPNGPKYCTQECYLDNKRKGSLPPDPPELDLPE